MNAAELIVELEAQGIKLEAQGYRLRFWPRTALSNELLEQLAEYKPEILALLVGEDPEVAGRVQAMLPQIPDEGQIPSLLVAFENIEPKSYECLSCGELLNTNQIWLCTYCERAKNLAIEFSMLDAAQRTETTKTVN